MQLNHILQNLLYAEEDKLEEIKDNLENMKEELSDEQKKELGLTLMEKFEQADSIANKQAILSCLSKIITSDKEFLKRCKRFLCSVFQHDDGRLRYQAEFLLSRFSAWTYPIISQPKKWQHNLMKDLSIRLKELLEEYKQEVSKQERNKLYIENLRPSKYKSLQSALHSLVNRIHNEPNLRKILAQEFEQHPLQVVLAKKEDEDPFRKEKLELLEDKEFQQQLQQERQQTKEELESALKYYEIEDDISVDSIKDRFSKIDREDHNVRGSFNRKLAQALDSQVESSSTSEDPYYKVLPLLNKFYELCPQRRLMGLCQKEVKTARRQGQSRVEQNYKDKFDDFVEEKKLPTEQALKQAEELVVDKANNCLKRLIPDFSITDDFMIKLSSHYDQKHEQQVFSEIILDILDHNPKLNEEDLNTPVRWLQTVLNYRKITTEDGRTSSLIVENLLNILFNMGANKPGDLGDFYKTILDTMICFEHSLSNMLEREQKDAQEVDFLEYDPEEAEQRKNELDSLLNHVLAWYVRYEPQSAYKLSAQQLALGVSNAIYRIKQKAGDNSHYFGSGFGDDLRKEVEWKNPETASKRLGRKIARTVVYHCKDLSLLLLDIGVIDDDWGIKLGDGVF